MSRAGNFGNWFFKPLIIKSICKMTTPLYPCLWFDNQAKDAAELYCANFKNSRIISETPVVVTFELNGKKILALNGGPMFNITPSISLTVYCETVEETNYIWNSLFEGGSSLIPIGSYPWSERYGWLKDKFGMTWQISVSTLENMELRILPSMLFVGKQFGKAAEAIGFYSGIFKKASTGFMVNYPENDPNAGKVMYSEFSLNGAELIAMDGPGEHAYTFNEGVSLVVECESQNEIDYYWDKLTNDGEESMCGWLKDKFGVSWQIIPAILPKLMADPERAPKVFDMFKDMRKLEINKLIIE